MRVRRVLSSVVLVGLVAVLAAGAYGGWVLLHRSEPVELPAPTGAYAVGRTDAEFADGSRKDPFAPTAGVPRRLAVWVWYPVSPGTTGARAEYAPGWWNDLRPDGPAAFFQGPFEAVRSHAIQDAPVAPSRFPVVVLSPAMGLSAPQYATLAEDLASHGYVVAALTPTYSAKVTVLGGRTITDTDQGNPGDLDDSSDASVGDRMVDIWAADARFVAKMIVGQNTSGLLTGRINTAAEIAYVGHGFGGAAALEACRLDPRCGAAVDLDGRQFGEVVSKGLEAPFLLLGAEDSCITGTCGPEADDDADERARAQDLIRASTGTRWCSVVDDARHYNFTDYGAYYVALPVRRTLPLGTIAPTRAFAVQNGAVVEFLDHTIRNRPAQDPPVCQPTP